MDWSNRLTAKLIECYENYPCLFDTTSNLYKNKHARKDAIFKICECMKKSDAETITIEDVKKKITNIRSQFTHEHNKVKESKRSGAGTEDLYEPTVWWYEKLLFLIPYIKARKGESSLALKVSTCFSMFTFIYYFVAFRCKILGTPNLIYQFKNL